MAFIGKMFVKPDTAMSCVDARHFFGTHGECGVCNATCSDAMEEAGKLAEGGYGVLQLLFLMAAYGYVLVNAANLIGDGAELLLLVPSLATLVGTLVLPILGAVPDGAIVFFSGFGPSAQEDLSVGMGALAGSTIMLLTIPWFLSIYAGRVDLNELGVPIYKKVRGVPKLSPGRGMSQCGIGADSSVKSSSTIMLATCISYVIIQGPAFLKPTAEPTNQHHKGLISGESGFALVGLIFCVLLFVGVCVYQFMTGESEEAQQDVEALVAAKQKEALREGLMNFTGMFREQLIPLSQGMRAGGGDDGLSTSLVMGGFSTEMGNVDGGGVGGGAGMPQSTFTKVKSFLRPLFNRYDTDSSGSIDANECRDLFRDLGERATDQELRAIVEEKYDTDGDGEIGLDEFCHVMISYAIQDNRTSTASHATQPAATVEGGEHDYGDAEDEEEEEEMPEDLAHLSPMEQQRRIKRRALYKMTVGTVLVLLFSDPMCDCLGALGERTGCPAFYISFVLAPLASNGTELLAAYNFALKKTQKSVTVSLSQLEGAAIMNNTFCLGIFLFLVYLQDLTWAYSAETIVILLVQLIMVFFARKPVQTMLDGWIILSLFPASIVMVIFMENVLGWD